MQLETCKRGRTKRARARILKSPRKTASRGRYVVPSVSAVPRARGNAAGSGRAPRALDGSTAAWDSFVVVRSKCAIATVDLHSPPTRHDALRRCSVDTPAAAGLCPCKLVPRLSRMAAGCPAARRAAYSTRGERARRWDAAGTRRTALVLHKPSLLPLQNLPRAKGQDHPRIGRLGFVGRLFEYCSQLYRNVHGISMDLSNRSYYGRAGALIEPITKTGAWCSSGAYMPLVHMPRTARCSVTICGVHMDGLGREQ